MYPRYLAGCLLATMACAPTQAELFDPVAVSAEERAGVRPRWRRDQEPADGRVKEALSRPLTADSAALIAVLNSPALQESYAELAAAGATLQRARTVRNPHAEAELLFPLEGGETHLELHAVMSVTDLLGMLTRIRGADAGVRAVRRRAVAMTLEVAAEARAGYFAAASGEHMLALRRIVAEAAVASATLARSLYEAGNITRLDLVRETVFEEEAALAVLRAEATATAAREHLNTVLGLTGAEGTWTIESELPRPVDELGRVAELEQDAVAASLELEALRWEAKSARQGVSVARLESFLPDLEAGVGGKREGHWDVGPVIGVSLPLFDWGGGARAEAWASLRGIQHRYTATAIAVRAAARTAGAQLVAAHARVIRIRTVLLPMREQLLDEAVKQYNAMNLDAFELLVIRREHIEAEVEYVAALRDYWTAQVRADQLRAGSLPRDAAPEHEPEAAPRGHSTSRGH